MSIHDGFPTVQGRCPACGGQGLFLGSGGYVTCPRIDCPAPDAASSLLEQQPSTTTVTIEPVLPDLTVTKLARWAPACPEGRHYPPHPGDTCDEVDASIVAARDQRIADVLTDRWLYGDGAGSPLGLLTTADTTPSVPTPEQRALGILRPHLATEPLYTEG
ncbi:hypothetical protein YUYDRAFT_02107 [Streptomyces sp. ScaeMP-e48]|uniref:DUF6085 family protein n=1 Tax=Streptomyces sp. ScaeMP-e48 TaxID=1100823 RepID=UPI0008238FE8|nr:DUF6085 family protein [Streptomyces sp. ScaeMP-e48]SCK20249.1 hypothetical protein YUYDRAFT_02107 [Streptomyces sp. ScaeMP-e48]